MTTRKKQNKKIKREERLFFQKMEKILLQEKEKLKKRLKMIDKHRPVLSKGGMPSELLDYDKESTDAAIQQEEVDRILATEEHLYHLLSKIDNALEKIKQGTYGICEHCHQKIGKARLKVIPSSTLCIKCQKLYDEGLV